MISHRLGVPIIVMSLIGGQEKKGFRNEYQSIDSKIIRACVGGSGFHVKTSTSWAPWQFAKTIYFQSVICKKRVIKVAMSPKSPLLIQH